MFYAHTHQHIVTIYISFYDTSNWQAIRYQIIRIKKEKRRLSKEDDQKVCKRTFIYVTPLKTVQSSHQTQISMGVVS